MFSNSQEAKKAGHFSRRHQTNEALEKNRSERVNKGEVKKNSATKRAEASANRSPREQLRLLDERFSNGLGAKKERARLNAKIAAA